MRISKWIKNVKKEKKEREFQVLIIKMHKLQNL